MARRCLRPIADVEDPAFGTCQVKVTDTKAETVNVHATINGTEVGADTKDQTPDGSSPKTVVFVAGPIDLGEDGSQISADSPVAADRFQKLGADGASGVEGVFGVLENHGQTPPPHPAHLFLRQAEQVQAAKRYAARRYMAAGSQQTHD